MWDHSLLHAATRASQHETSLCYTQHVKGTYYVKDLVKLLPS